MQITVKIQSQYGNKRVFPACEKSALLAKFADCKTFSTDQLGCIRKLGFEIVVKPQTL